VQRKKKTSTVSTASTASTADVLSYDSVIKGMKDFVRCHDGRPSPGDFLQELRVFQATLAFDERIRLFIALSSLCGEELNQQSLTHWKNHVGEVISSGKHGALPGPDVLWAFDAHLAGNPAKGFAAVLKLVYDEDWCSEQAMLSYYNDNQGKGQPGFEQAKEKAVPLLKWLVETASDSDSS